MFEQSLILVKNESDVFSHDVIQVLYYLNLRSDQKELRQHVGNQGAMNVNQMKLTSPVPIPACI